MLINYSIIRCCLFVSLLTFLPFAAYGITGKLYEYDKLTNSLVTQLCQDKYGCVWIASDFGLNRFDGYHFVNYYYSSRDSLSIPHNLVRSLLCTKDGQMFIGTGKGLARYDYTTIPKLREQFNLAYKSGIDRIWIINVGDLKPKEVPINFIMDYAWNPDAIQPGDEKAWLEGFTRSVFGEEYAAETADIIAKYSKYNLWLNVPLNVSPGKHTLRIVMIDPEIVVEQIVVNPDNNHYSYFGAKEK